MPDNAIALTTCDWVEAASTGKIKVFAFPKGRKKGIKALGPGSIVLVMCKKEGTWVFCGEFEVKDVRKIYSGRYRKLVRKGVIYHPIELKPNEYVWGLIFDEFIKYPRDVPLSELKDVKTSTSHKPLSEWVIIGLTYLKSEDIHVINEVRNRAFPITYIVSKIQKIEQRLAQLEASLKK